MQVAILMVHVVIAVALVVLILLQPSREKVPKQAQPLVVVRRKRFSARGAVVTSCRVPPVF